MKTRSFLLAAGVLLAMALTFSCDSGGGGDGTGGGSSSSGGGGPGPGGNSSSGGGGYTGCSGGGSGSTCTNFKTTKIGEQTWMAENLNCDPGTGNSACYDNDLACCAKYGRLYDWSTAMGLPSSCNDNSCSSQIQSKHRGICPSGWHLPSDAEWTVLTDYVGGRSTAGTKLKATSGWNDDGNGTDDYGFSALPGGGGRSGGSFGYVGDDGYWWSASEVGTDNASLRYMSYYFSSVDFFYNGDKSRLYSVRCLQD